ncbi:hypothetical protein [Nocardiopsis sp. LOL_012]|uniref:hypothetical protein n=1 Tax=Nocardiopsis sp. LOL_012 TaxID=3345409 RepID=UPI003A8AF87F
MSAPHRHRRSRGRLGTTLLAAACCAGAFGYALLVATSVQPSVDTQATTTALSADLGDAIVQGDGGAPVETGPVGRLRIHVSTPDRAWVQTLNCTGDPAADPQACTRLAEISAELDAAAATSYAGEGITGETSADRLFTEVSEGTVCTDQLYGPEEATVEGVWEGEEVATSLSRAGSCEEARWQRLEPLTGEIG